MSNFEITHDKTMRKITVQMYDFDGNLTEETARAMADKRLADEGTSKDWYFEETYRMSYDWVDVYYVA